MTAARRTAESLRLTEADLIAWGERFGREARPPVVVALEGELGAGKTTLARAICRGFGAIDEVTSPTFALVHQYDAATAPVYHLDLYRISGPEELTNLGWDDIMSDRALILVEWPERAAGRLPASAVHLALSHVAGSPDVRLLRVVGAGGGA